jgi:gluconokinase
MNPASSLPTLITVMGVSGCGKTTLGKALALALDAAFLDADDYHPDGNVSKMRAGRALTDEDREPWLARLNDELKQRRARSESVILACSALKQYYRMRIAKDLAEVTWVFLVGEFQEIAERMQHRRQTSGHYMPESLLRSQFEALEPPNQALRIQVNITTDEQLLQIKRALLQQH